MHRLAIVLSLAALAVLGSGWEAQASVIWDYSPALYGVSTPNYANRDGQYQFAERIIFGIDTLVGGMDIYSGRNAAFVGDTVKVSLWADASGHPGSLLASETPTISMIDLDGASTYTDRKHVDLATPLALSASTVYWIGMTGVSRDIGQGSLATIPPGADGKMAYYSGGSYYGLVGTMDMAFRLYSEEAPAIPEPTTCIIWSLFGAGGLGIGWWRRRRTG